MGNGAISGNQVRPISRDCFCRISLINSWFIQYGSRSINAVEALNTLLIPIWFKLPLRWWGNPTLQIWLYGSSGSCMKNPVFYFAEYGLWTSTGIDLPNESTGFIPKEYTVGNYLTNAFGQFDNYTPCNWLSMRQNRCNDGKGKVPMPSKESMTHDQGTRQLKNRGSKPRSSPSPYLSGGHGSPSKGFTKWPMVRAGLTMENCWSWGHSAHQCKDWGSWNHWRWGKQALPILMWWRMHHRIIQDCGSGLST